MVDAKSCLTPEMIGKFKSPDEPILFTAKVSKVSRFGFQ